MGALARYIHCTSFYGATTTSVFVFWYKDGCAEGCACRWNDGTGFGHDLEGKLKNIETHHARGAFECNATCGLERHTLLVFETVATVFVLLIQDATTAAQTVSCRMDPSMQN